MNHLGVVALILLCESSLSGPSIPSPSSSPQNDIATKQTPASSTRSTSLNRMFNRTSNATIPYSAPLESKLTEEASLSTTAYTGTTGSSWPSTITSGVPTTDTPKIVHRCRNDELECPGKKCTAITPSTKTAMGYYNIPIKCECTGRGDREGWYRPNRELIATNTHNIYNKIYNKTILNVKCNSRYIPRKNFKTGCTWFSTYSLSDGVTMVSYRVGDPDTCEQGNRAERSAETQTALYTTQPVQRWKIFTKDPWVTNTANQPEMCRPGTHYCSSGQCWIKTEVSSGKYAHKDGYGIVNCSCIIPGTGKDTDDIRWHFSDNDKRIRYPMVRFIQCNQHSYDLNIGQHTMVTCGWFTEDRFTKSFRSNANEAWNYEKWSKGLKIVGTPYDCALESKKFGEMLIAIIIFVILFLAIIVFIWALRRNGHCGTDVVTDSASNPPLPSVSQVPRPTDPTWLRTPSIPTYSECLEGSHRIVSDSNYISLPTTEEQGPPSYGDDLLEKLPPAYEDIEGHEDLYNVAGNAEHVIESRV
ncbi:uncharacterized protein LOC134813342 [Bolinopsis microptera]|uniref:uncharacterized protein LOC134813342 n=1 Tax=Bolinopsis microptera TaxID=2820187 RepID=UPI00307AEE3F